MSEEFFTPKEVAEKPKVSTQTVLNKIHSGEWECQKISARTFRFTVEQFDLITSKPAVDHHRGKSRELDAEWRRALSNLTATDMERIAREK